MSSSSRAFKSFRLKKKSSTLGIYKTSESPPPLRRDQCPLTGDDRDGASWNSFDHRLRQSHNITSSSLHLENGQFERNATYRSSLQHLPASSGSSQQVRRRPLPDQLLNLHLNCTFLLQDSDTNASGLGFHRNDNYRSTIQVAGGGGMSQRGFRRGHRPAPPRPAMSVSPPARRYVVHASGSMTPEPTRTDNYLFAHRLHPKRSPIQNG